MLPEMSLWTGIALMTVVATWEELLFRGFLMTRIRRFAQSWTIAVIASTVAFVLPHALEQTPAAMIPISILSLVLSLVTIWRRSIVPAIVAHALWNVAVFLTLTLESTQPLS